MSWPPVPGGNGALAHTLWNSENVDFSSVAGIFGVECYKGAKAFLAGSHGRTNEGDSGALAHTLWNLKNVDFSGVARIFGVKGHNGAKAFLAGSHGRTNERGNGALAHPPGI